MFLFIRRLRRFTQIFGILLMIVLGSNMLAGKTRRALAHIGKLSQWRIYFARVHSLNNVLCAFASLREMQRFVSLATASMVKRVDQIQSRKNPKNLRESA
jgi:uncharacterized protein YpbB